MLYKAIAAIVFKGGKIRQGQTVEVTDADAAVYADSLAPVQAAAATVQEPKAEKALDDMSSAELKAKAKKLGLKASGSAADIRERIALHLEGSDASGEEPKELLPAQ